jgi:hypothetical protein
MSSHSFHSLPASLGVLLSLLAATSCGSSGPVSLFGDPNITISVAPQIASVPVNGTVTFTSTVANTSSTPGWYLNGTFGVAGSLSTYGGTTTVYTAPPAPPIYNDGIDVNGTVTLTADVAETFISDATATQTFVITAPSVTTGITPLTATVPLNGTAQFTAYAVGNINNAVTVQVNGVTGGSTSAGTIVYEPIQSPMVYLYTAPAAMPMTGNTVTITVISQADPTKTQTAIVTLH